MAMQGINYLVNDAGERTAVVIDLKTYGDELEDFLDGLEAQSRRDEPKEDFDAVVNRPLNEKVGMRKYTVVITKSAEKELTKLPVQVILRIREAVNELADGPRPPTCKKLKGFKDLYRIRIGDYRVIYS